MNKGSFASLIPTELVERLTAATVGSRELDFWVALEMGELDDVVRERPSRVEPGPGDELTIYSADGKRAGWVGYHAFAPVTTSLDAALALAERVLGGKNALHLLADLLSYEAASSDFDLVTVADVPRQLCIAILKALAAQASNTAGGYEAEGGVNQSPTPTPSEETPSTPETEERG